MDVVMLGIQGVVEHARAATEREMMVVKWPGDQPIALGGVGGRDLLLAWLGTVCDVHATLVIAPARLEVSPAPRPGCDDMNVARGVVLTFAKAMDPSMVAVMLADTRLLPETP